MKLENLDNRIRDDLGNRNDNWNELDNIPTRVNDLETNKQETQVKVAKVEKELNTLKSININSNQEATQVSKGHGVVNLPKTAGEGHADFGIKGLTTTNLIVNGDFRSGTTGWTASANMVANVNNIKAIARYGRYNNSSPTWEIGSKYYLSTKIDIKQATNELVIIISGVNSAANATVYTYQQGLGIQYGSKIFTINNFYDDRNKVISIMDFSESNWAEADIGYLSVINLTQTFGAGNEPTKEQCDVIFSNYFEGTQSVQGAMRVKSVGKNLFDKEAKILYPNKAWLSESGTMTDNSLFDIYDLIKINPSTVYTKINMASWIALFDDNRNFIIGINAGIFTTPQNARYVSVGVERTKKDIAQLEQNTVSTPYEPYTESISYLNAKQPLRSLPNGVVDEIRVSGGKAEWVNRNNRVILNGSDITAMITIYSNLDYVGLKKPIDFINYGKYVSGGFVLDGYSSYGNYTYDVVENIGKVTATGAGDVFWVGLPKGTTLTQARTALAGTTLTYQLAEPITTPIQTSGSLIAYPSGTVYIEQVVADAGMYTTKMDILNTELPIKTLDKLSKVDYTTGLERSLDVSKAVVSAQSFTHPDLAMGDIVFFEYYYDLESTNGNASVKYYDSRYTVKDSVTNKVYKWSITIANGVPTITTVEV